ncbi:hypothetical protein C2G38_2234264 [Gigaspora rosea]|uniref:Uncharacterized protein n=1 Tax=Gigaspora rosea TaxID=44941 RepID=A0A397TU75_9GLOM|nr:hypothetical protein C2G38_2234264 [Gigaspora rosea]
MLDPLACVREEMKIQQYFDFVSSEENENEGTIEESINDDGAVDNDRADDDDNDSTSELNALEAGMERYQTSWKKICEEYAVLCNRNPGQLKDKARTRDPSQGQ